MTTYNRRKAEKLCTRCGNQDKRVLSGRTMCFKCAKDNAAYCREYRKKKKTAQSGNSETV